MKKNFLVVTGVLLVLLNVVIFAADFAFGGKVMANFAITHTKAHNVPELAGVFYCIPAISGIMLALAAITIKDKKDLY